MKATAVVIAEEKGLVILEMMRRSACDGCHKSAEGGCELCRLAGEEKPIRAKANNPIGAVAGDTVTVESAASDILLYAACVFLLPLVCLALGFFIGSLLSELVWVRALSAGLGFVLCFLGLRCFSKSLEQKRSALTVTEILSHQQKTESLDSDIDS